MVAEKEKEITVIGAGIVGLIAAYYFNKAGLKGSVSDKGPDPLTSYDRHKTGTTFSGGNARHVSATETTPHAASSMNGLIYRSPAEGGWLAKDKLALTDVELEWMDHFNRLTWKKELFAEFTQTVIDVNNQGKALWRKLMKEDRKLFQDTNIHGPATVFFVDDATFRSETITESRANTSVRILSPKQIMSGYPALRNAVVIETIVGGLIIDSFALNAISFCKNVINQLKSDGVNFRWNQIVNNVADTGKASDYYFVSTGAAKQDFLTGDNHDKIMGVVGVWIKIPNPGLLGPIKIATPYPSGYINGTIENQSLVLSGGYGFIGQDKLDEQSEGIQALFEDLRTNVANIFPTSYATALKEKTLDQKACVRPMKSSGLGVFEVLNRDGYKLIFAGGNNAGGFTQAPAIAEAALEVIRTGDSPLRLAYSEDRLLYRNPSYP